MVELESDKSGSMLSLEDIPADAFYPTAGESEKQVSMNTIGVKEQAMILDARKMATIDQLSIGRTTRPVAEDRATVKRVANSNPISASRKKNGRGRGKEQIELKTKKKLNEYARYSGTKKEYDQGYGDG